MIKSLNIFGADIIIPESPPIEQIENWGESDIKEQYWKKKNIPIFFEVVEYDKDGNVLLTREQEQYAKEEVRKCKDGFWFFNCGEPTFITGKNYFYLQYWKLEDDIFPDYRDLDRRYFLFLNHWENTPSCLGILIGKKRRQGATSVATSNLVYECIFYKNSFCGLTSKTQIDAKTAFTNMVSFGYRQLPVFLKPKQLNNKDSVSELIFAHKSVEVKGTKGNVIDTDTGHRSKVDYRAPSLNAYDSGRLSRGLFDEGSKFPREVPFSTFISIVSKTLIKGVKRVGFIECPSTTNAMSNGGEEFKKVWDNSNQFKYKRTPTRLVKYITPAYDGYMGFIDRYGMSVIDEPTEDQYKYLVENFVGIGDLMEEDVSLGAKRYLQSRRELLTGTDLEEEIRMNPFSEEEMFLYAGTKCEFNVVNLNSQLTKLEEKPVFLRRCRLEKKETTTKDIFGNITTKDEISFMDDERGGWLLYEEPEKQNNYTQYGSYMEPQSTYFYSIGVDTTKDDFAIHGSKPTICVMKKSNIVNGEERGMYPVAFYDDKTRLDVHFDDEVLKACMWYGCKVNYEIDARTDFYKYFIKMDAATMLEWTPKFAQDPVRKKALEPGTRSGNPYQLSAQLQAAKMYLDGTDPVIYNGFVHKIVFPELLKQLLKYDHSNRTKFDQCIALFMALLPMMSQQTAQQVKDSRPKELLPTYAIKSYV